MKVPIVHADTCLSDYWSGGLPVMRKNKNIFQFQVLG